MLPLIDHSADVVTCLEVLEHLVAPERAVGELARICRGRCVVSVPWEPFFRLGNLCRGRDVGRWGNNPEHVQHFSPATLRHLLLDPSERSASTRVSPGSSRWPLPSAKLATYRLETERRCTCRAAHDNARIRERPLLR